MQVQLLFGNAMNSGFDLGEAIDRGQRLGLDGIRRIRVLDDSAQDRDRSLDTLAGMHQHARASNVAARFAPYLDSDLVAKPHRLDRGVDDSGIAAGIDERPQRHVAGDSRKAIEICDGHARVLVIFTAAASIGRMLCGRFAIRTDTPTTLSSSSTRSAIRWARVSMSFADSPS